MANIGRVYKRLFERDFGFRSAAGFIYLPARYLLPSNTGLIQQWYYYTDNNEPSEVGEADYSLGKVIWRWNPPDAVTPGAFARLEWELTDDEYFGRFTQYQGVDGVDYWKRESLHFNNAFPSAPPDGPETFLVPKPPNKYPFNTVLNSWRWSNGPPQ